jgi:hypothetical protein
MKRLFVLLAALLATVAVSGEGRLQFGEFTWDLLIGELTVNDDGQLQAETVPRLGVIPGESEFFLQETWLGDTEAGFDVTEAEAPLRANAVYTSDEGGRFWLFKLGNMPGSDYLKMQYGLVLIEADGPFTVYLMLTGTAPGEYYTIAAFSENADRLTFRQMFTLEMQ